MADTYLPGSSSMPRQPDLTKLREEYNLLSKYTGWIGSYEYCKKLDAVLLAVKEVLDAEQL